MAIDGWTESAIEALFSRVELDDDLRALVLFGVSLSRTTFDGAAMGTMVEAVEARSEIERAVVQPVPDNPAVLLRFAVGYGLSEWHAGPDAGIVDPRTGDTLIDLVIDNTGYLPFLAEVRRGAGDSLILPRRCEAMFERRDGSTYTLHHGGGNLSYQVAERKSVELLKEWLDPEQLAQFEKTSTFDVIGGTSGRRYTIEYASRPSNVVGHDMPSWFWKSSTSPRLCFLPEGILAPGDIMLAQKIALEKDEYAALKVAAISS